MVPVHKANSAPQPRHDDAFVQDLFDRMGPSYGLVNLVSSFGFSHFWRWRCVRQAEIPAGGTVCDLMSGTGECWASILRRTDRVISIDFSQGMCARQRTRNAGLGERVEVRCENALRTSLAPGSVVRVVAAFGLKTLSPEALDDLAREIRRILKPDGRFSLIEISSAQGWWLGPLYRWYLRCLIPRIGRLCLGDPECYRMLGIYTEAFRSCDHVVQAFARAGLHVTVHRHFFGCATSLVGSSPPC